MGAHLSSVENLFPPTYFTYILSPKFRFSSKSRTFYMADFLLCVPPHSFLHLLHDLQEVPQKGTDLGMPGYLGMEIKLY